MSKLGTRWIEDAAITNVKVATGIDALKMGDGSVSNTEFEYLGSLTTGLLDASLKGVSNGLAELDSGGKVPASQLPTSVMEYQGTWNASTNSPTLADGTGDAGDVYIVNVAGSQDLGSGSITFAIGDWAIYNGTIWELSLNSNAVSSVNSQTGAVVLDADDISDAATTNKFSTSAQLAKIDFISVTQAVDLDDLETASHASTTLNADDATQQTLNLSGQELQVNLATASTDGAMSAEDKSKLDNVEAGATADQIALDVPFTPAGNLDAYDVQEALEELDSDKEPVITAGTTAQYLRGDKSLSTFATDAKSAAVDDTVYGASWNGVTDVAASKNAVYDKIEALASAVSRTSNQEELTLVAGDITAEYIDLAQTPAADSVVVVIEGVTQRPDVDFTVVGDRLYFGDADVSGPTSSDLDPSNADGVIAGDKLYVSYVY